MRVAVCHPTYWPEVRRGAERFAHDLAAGLGATVITSHRGPLRRAHEDGVEVLRLPRLPSGRLRRRLFEDHLPHMAALHLALRRERPDAVVALQATDALAAARAGIPTVFAFMGIPHRGWLTARRARLEIVQGAVREAAAVTALSRAAADGFERWLGVEARMIHPGVDLERFTIGRRAEHPLVVCAAAPGEPRKRVDLLRRAVALLGREDLELLVEGDPAPLSLPRDYQRAWVSVLPSWGEAFGLVLAEALACGAFAVGSDRDGIPEVLDGNARVGRLFSGDEPQALAAALEEVLALQADPVACREHVSQRFSLERCVGAYRELLGSL